MSLATAEGQFTRQSGALWRDTGRHVLALPSAERAVVVVLGGGGAVLWRLLEEPLRLTEVMSRLQTSEGAAPAEAEVLACLDDLVQRGLVEVSGSPR